MTGVAAVCVGLAAVVVMWPRPGRRARGRRLLAPAAAGSGRWRAALRVARRLDPRVAGSADRTVAPARAALAALVAAIAGALLAGPVAGAVVGGYAALAVHLAAGRAAERARAGRRTERLDQLAAAAADLRAGLPAGTALAGLAGDGDPLQLRATAAVVLAERTGAPLAEVLERIEADARLADRARAAATAQTAGSRATAALLASLPLGGIGLGYAIGADPLAVLLRTPVGAACAGGAVALQFGGLAWVSRIIRGAKAARS